VHENARVCGDAQVCGDAEVHGSATTGTPRSAGGVDR
jgi:hypothetical protein